MKFCSAYSTLPSLPYQHFLTKLADSMLMPIPPDDWGISYEHALYLANRGFVQRPAPTTAARIRRYVAGTYSRKSPTSRAANHLVDGFKSPMDARLYLLLQLPFRLGGSALPTVVNRQFSVGPEAARPLGRGHYELDLYVPSARYGIEYDGRFDHEDNRQSSFDRKKRYFLEREGIRIIGLDRHQARNRQLLEQYVNDIWEASGLRKRLTIDETRYGRIRGMRWCDLFDYGTDLYRPRRPTRSISVRNPRRGYHAQSAIYHQMPDDNRGKHT
jgi:very-short-patch-repair endonuclease